MSTTLTIEVPVHFHRRGHGSRKELRSGAEAPPLPPGRVPRVARLMALALRFDELVRTGPIRSYSELASLGQVTRARVCQIMNLLYLAPDIQEALLFLPPTQRGRDALILADLQPIAAPIDWRKQRRLWRQLLPA
jgi:hypothetical protein